MPFEENSFGAPMIAAVINAAIRSQIRFRTQERRPRRPAEPGPEPGRERTDADEPPGLAGPSGPSVRQPVSSGCFCFHFAVSSRCRADGSL
jgi:hypothetical protein